MEIGFRQINALVYWIIWKLEGRRASFIWVQSLPGFDNADWPKADCRAPSALLIAYRLLLIS
jgi:hypothetical protein